ncbi:hypothetical protein BBJ28_00021052 [Nothophytophthora sp. Chile5]|nr:hypothetical protein BBJ28_00021052 [Nothophytophthora sp. Chile5]
MATKNPPKRKAALRQKTMDADTVPAAKTANKGETFIDSHRLRYGLTIGSTLSKTKKVETVVCLFCYVFGREDAPRPLDSTKKPRKRTVKPKFFTSFRTDLYEKHLNSQHSQKWKQYNDVILDDDKEAFFDMQSVPHVCPCDDLYNGQYQVTEANPSRFRLCVRFLGHGASFRMAAALMDGTKEETGIGRFQGCTELVAARYARVVCAVSLECLAQMMQSTWAFSIALDCATHQGKSYVDIRSRFLSDGILHNYHLLAIPLHERHTADNIFAVVKRFLDALVSEWRDQLVGVSTDGAANMV